MSILQLLGCSKIAWKPSRGTRLYPSTSKRIKPWFLKNSLLLLLHQVDYKLLDQVVYNLLDLVVYKLLKMKLKRWITSGRSVANLRLCHEPLHHLPMLFQLNQFSCLVRLCHLHHHHCPLCPQSMIFSWKHRGRLRLLIIRYCHNNLGLVPSCWYLPKRVPWWDA